MTIYAHRLYKSSLKVSKYLFRDDEQVSQNLSRTKPLNNEPIPLDIRRVLKRSFINGVSKVTLPDPETGEPIESLFSKREVLLE